SAPYTRMSTNTPDDRASKRRRGAWIALVVSASALAAGFIKCGDAKRSKAPETATAPNSNESAPAFAALPSNARLKPAFNPTWPTEAGVAISADPSALSEEKQPHPECKRAPIRGCAPSKDELGCFHCARCWRPFVYDSTQGLNTFSFACPDML